MFRQCFYVANLMHEGVFHVFADSAGGLGHIGVQCLRALTAASIVVIDVNEAALELALEATRIAKQVTP